MRTISWGKLRAALKKHGIEIDHRGSEAKLTRRTPGGTLLYVLQHECCKSKSTTVWATHLSAIKRKFGLTDDDLR